MNQGEKEGVEEPMKILKRFEMHQKGAMLVSRTGGAVMHQMALLQLRNYA